MKATQQTREKDPMFIALNPRLVLPVTGLLITAGFIVHPQSGEWRARLSDWVSPANSEVARVVESPASPDLVIAEGRVVAYEGAEVVVGTEVSGLIIRLTVKEKSTIRAGDIIAESSSADLRASLAEAMARVAEAEADIRFYERVDRRERALLARNATTPENFDANFRSLELARARRSAAGACCDPG
jgi:multidrug efflux pump subunit AcrA (membrane-fusion protein)